MIADQGKARLMPRLLPALLFILSMRLPRKQVSPNSGPSLLR